LLFSVHPIWFCLCFHFFVLLLSFSRNWWFPLSLFLLGFKLWDPTSNARRLCLARSRKC
jgi:hypothetical protein